MTAPMLFLALLFVATVAYEASVTDGRAEFFVNVELNQIKNAKAWLDEGGDINIQSANGKTALMRASQEQHYDMMRFLIARGAEVNIQNARGVSAIGLLSYQIESMKILIHENHAIVKQEHIDEAYADGYNEKGDLLQNYVDGLRNMQGQSSHEKIDM